MRRLREHITPAILVALLAAFCADGGAQPLAEYEKAPLWGTSQMKNLHKHDRAAVEAQAAAIADCDLDRLGHQPRCVPR